MQSGTLIDTSKPFSAGQWLAHLSQVQHQRLTGRMDALAAQGVHPADGWQMAALHQRIADVPGYAPTPEEQTFLARTTHQVAATRDSAGLAQAASGDRPDAVTNQPCNHDRLVEQPVSTPSTDEVAMAQTILDHADPLMRRAIAAGQAPTAAGGWQLVNNTYRVTLSAEGELRVENRCTGGEVRGTVADGVQATQGLTESDQQAWQSTSVPAVDPTPAAREPPSGDLEL
jgi:hypothetical protein